MAFKAAFVAHAPDANPEEHKALIETEKYKLFVAVVSGQDQALSVCKDLAEKEGVQSILLCPGFSHQDVAAICEAVGPEVGIGVARTDSAGGRIAGAVIAREWGIA